MTDYSTIPNPGVSPNERLGFTAGGGAVGASSAYLLWDFPAFFFVDLWGPVVYTALFVVGTFLAVRVRKNPFELAIQEFDNLGLRPELIGEVIVENRAKAHQLGEIAGNLQMTDIRKALRGIKEETLAIINGFQDDPTDVARSRSNLRRVLDQALKVAQNYATLEAKGDRLTNFQDTHDQTLAGLQQMRSVLAEQHKRNAENNTTALEVDLEVSDQLLSKLANQ